MDASFWHQRWENNETGFHESVVNPLLLKHVNSLKLTDGSRIFLPLCGKTLDIGWFHSKGYRVAGVELSELAVRELFSELALDPQITTNGDLLVFQADNISIFVGDVFHLTADILGNVDAMYDRAALVALPQAIRVRYSEHLCAITNRAKQLLLCIEYEQSLMEGPPFSVIGKEINTLYSSAYTMTHLESREIVGGFKNEVPAQNTAWLLY